MFIDAPAAPDPAAARGQVGAVLNRIIESVAASGAGT
jgi:hypothetical protein